MNKSLIILVLISFLIFTNLNAQSPIYGKFELRFSWFLPNIDDESSLNEPVYENFFGSRGFQYGFEYGYFLMYDDDFGAVNLSLGMDYFSKSGNTLNDLGETTDDESSLTLIPIKLTLEYDLIQLEKNFNIPFSLYAKFGFQYKFWYIEDSIGDYAKVNGNEAKGGKFGYHWGLGLRLLLDFLDQDAALSFDNDLGVNDSYLFVEYSRSSVDNFGKKGLKIGGNAWTLGLNLVF